MARLRNRAPPGGERAGLLLGSLVALDPVFVRESTTARPYGLWLCAGMAYLVAADSFARRPSLGRGLGVSMAAAAMLHLHYLSVLPLLASGAWLVAVRPRQAPFSLLGAVVLALPLLARVHPQQTAELVTRASGVPELGAMLQIFGVSLLALFGARAWDWRSLPAGARHLLVMLLASIVGIVAVGTLVELRWRYAHFLHLAALPLLALAIQRRMSMARASAAFFVVLALLGLAEAVTLGAAYFDRQEDDVRRFVGMATPPAGTNVYVSPSSMIEVGSIYLRGKRLERGDRVSCTLRRRCFADEGVRYYGIDAAEEVGPGMWLDVSYHPLSPPPGCRELAALGVGRLFRCAR